MNVLKKGWAKFTGLSLHKRIQIIVAATLTIALLIAVPVNAWFSYQKKIVTLKKIDAPHPLFLSAAHREDTVCFEIEGIDADEDLVDGNNDPILSEGVPQKITYKDYVFNVTGDAVDKFTIQIAYTTNNPLTYSVFAAKELTEEPDCVAGQPVNYVKYVVHGSEMLGLPELEGEQYHLNATEGTILYYQIDTDIEEGGSDGRYDGIYLNSTDGTTATDDSYLEKAYGDYNNIHADAKPVYWQARNVSAFPGVINSNKDAFSRHFILRVQWSPENPPLNTAKETDIIYITVKATS